MEPDIINATPFLDSPLPNTFCNEIGGEYTFVCNLGKGTYGDVNKYYHAKSDSCFAIKSVAKSSLKSTDNKRLSEHEVYALKYFNRKKSRFCPKFYKMVSDSVYIHYVMEYLPGSTLNEFKFESTQEVWAAIKTLVDAVAEIHSLGLVHRDLKPENIIVWREFSRVESADAEELESNSSPSHPQLQYTLQLRIIDFGSVKILDDSQHHKFMQYIQHTYYKQDVACGQTCTFLGSNYYVSPEVIQAEQITYACDLWSLGCIIYKLTMGNYPFDAPNR